MVTRESPVASATRVIPPRPIARASAAAQRRRALSSSTGSRLVYFALMACTREFCLALASWCARRGGMHKTGGVFSGEIRGQG